MKKALLIDRVLEAGVANKVAPAASAAIGTLHEDAPLYANTKGVLSRRLKDSCTADTFFDLASLTKIVATTLISAEALLLGKIDLDERPFIQWPRVSVRDLLQHTSGLPAWRNLYAQPFNRERTISNALSLPAGTAHSSPVLYSDIGFIALCNLLEKRLKHRIDVIFDDVAKRYYKTNMIVFNPSNDIKTLCAPTGFCPARKRYLQGEVNDLNTFAMSGVSSHAGLFGRMTDVVRVARFFLKASRNPTSAIEHILYDFMNGGKERGLGFDKATFSGSTGGSLSRRSVGHLGFTGTSLWIDPFAAGGQGAYFVLLTNHVEISTRKKDILHLRREFHRAAKKLVG